MNRLSGWMRGLALIATLMFAAGSALAQETTGSISGTITDSSGAAVKGATVVLMNTDRNETLRTLTTSSAGFYTGTSLPLGTYTVKVTGDGFKTEAVTGLVLHVNDALTINRTLVAGNASETVSVTANSLSINLQDATSAGLITGEQIRELALNNRNYEQLILLQPGVAYGGASDQLYIGASLPSGTSAQVAFSVNGGRSTSNNWTIDGADNVDRGANLTLLAYPSVDAIAEFKTLRGTYTAEFGRSASGQINVVTKSGTNGIHGSAYEFFRNDIFNANNYFNKLTTPFTKRPALRYHDFGGTIGGPVVIPHLYDGRDKTFFFFSFEARRVINYSTPTTTFLPTDYERVGDFRNAYLTSAGARGPAAVCTSFNTTTGACLTYGTQVTNISPTAQAYIKDIWNNLPMPNSASDIAAGLDPHTYISSVRNIFNDNQPFVRIDQSIGSKVNVFYRYLHDSLPSTEGGGLFVGSALPGLSTTSTTAPGTQHLGHLTYTLSPTLLMNAGYAYSYGALLSTPTGLMNQSNSPDVKPSLPYTPTLGVVPTISISNFSGLSSAGVYTDTNHNHNAFGDVTKVLGRMTLIGGISYNHYEKKENALNNGSPYPAGFFGFANTSSTTPTAAQATAAGASAPSGYDNAWALFLLGNANNTFQQASIAATPDIMENLYEAYLQDNWKILPRLTLNAGVRYSYFAQPTDAGHQLSNFSPAAYVAANAPTIDSSGNICSTATCANTQGVNSGTANPSADPLNGIILGTPGAYGHASPYGSQVGSTPKTNFAPRVGFAFDVFGDGRTAFRGGYGWSFDESEVSFYETQVQSNKPYVVAGLCSTTVLDAPSAACVSTTPLAVVGSPLTYETPYIQQYSLDVQQQFTPTLILDVGYFGDHGTNLLGKIDINELQPGAFKTAGVNPGAGCTTTINGVATPAFISTACEKPLNQIRPYKGYNAINVVRPWFSSNYNSLQVKATKKFSGKSLIDVNYTWSRALTNSQNDYSTPPQNTYNINADYGRATIDRTNILTMDAIYELPFYRDQRGLVGHIVGGWELSGIYTVNSGLPLTPSMSGGSTVQYAGKTNLAGAVNGGVANDAAGLGVLGASAAGLRPDMIANPNNGYGYQIHTRLNWFNQAAFAAPAPGTLRPGNAKRGIIEGPGYNRLDVGIFRNFKIFNDLIFQLRGEAFNAANHTNWQGVTTTATSSAFGQVTSTRDARILQVAGKITF